MIWRYWVIGLALVIVTGCRPTAEAPRQSDEGLATSFDFTAESANPQRLDDDVRVEFDHESTGAYLVSGWSDPEVAPDGVSFTWANAAIAKLDVVLLHTDYAALKIRCNPFAHASLPRQQLQVTVNGRRLTQNISGLDKHGLGLGFRVIELPVPAETLLHGTNRIEFEFLWAVAPATVTQSSDDTRPLAAAFDYLHLVPQQPVIGTQPRGVAEVDNRGVTTPPGTGVVYSLTIPADAFLEFGLKQESRNSPSLGGEIWIRELGTASKIVTYPSFADPSEKLRVPLAAMADRHVELAFVNRERPGATTLLWIAPKVVHPQRRSKTLRNLVLIVVDTLRADYLHSYGAEIATPNTDRLAASGTLFERTYCHIPETVPSHATLFTSMLPFDHGVHSNGQTLHKDHHTLAEHMRSFGFKTAAFVSLGVLKREFGIAQGFGEYVDNFTHEPFLDASQVNEGAIKWIESTSEDPFFLWVHYSDPHEPYTAPNLTYPAINVDLNGQPVGLIDANGRRFSIPMELAPGDNTLKFSSLEKLDGELVFDTVAFTHNEPNLDFQKGWRTSPRYRSGSQIAALPTVAGAHHAGEANRKVQLVGSVTRLMDKAQTRYHYEREVEFVDAKIGELVAALAKKGLRENTLVVLTSDHGEGLGDHHLWGHVDQLYDTLLRVPLIFMAPGVVREGARVTTPAGLIDFMPTVLDMFELPIPRRLRGQSLLPEIVLTSAMASGEPRFVDVTAWAGLALNSNTFGAVFVDIDNDGDDDLLVSKHANGPSMYINTGWGHFSDRTDLLPPTELDRHGLTVVDLDNDGDRDIALASGGADGEGMGVLSYVFRNRLVDTGTLGFSLLPEGAGVGVRPEFRSRAFLPVASQDGTKVDLYLSCNKRSGFPNTYYRNVGHGDIRFSPTDDLGLTLSTNSEGMDVFLDADRDGDTDLLLMDEGKIRFFERRGERYHESPQAVFATLERVASIGVGDLNNDGFPDLYIGTVVQQTDGDRTAHSHKEVHFNFHRGSGDQQDQIIFESQSDELRADFLLKPGIIADDASDIFLGAQRSHPTSRLFTTSTAHAAGAPPLDEPGIYLWFDRSTDAWHMVVKYSQDGPRTTVGLLMTSGIRSLRMLDTESPESRDTSDMILFNSTGTFTPMENMPALIHTGATAITSLVDLNNDGFLDIVGLRRGSSGGKNGEPFLLLNQQGKRFTPTSSRPLQNDEDDIYAADQMVTADINNDGMLDIFFTNGWGLLPDNNGPFRLYLNSTSSPNRSLSLTLVGEKSNRDAIGAQVELWRHDQDSGKDILLGYRELGSGFNRSQSSQRLHFGTGRYAAAMTVRVRWPSGRETSHEIQGDSEYKIFENGEAVRHARQ